MNKQILELSNNLLSRYKKNAGASAGAADASGNLQKGNKRFSGIMKATRKQFSNDAKKSVAEGFSKLTPQQKAHEYNLDSAQREMDRRHHQGEDMTGAKIDKKTYKIIKPKKQGMAEAKDPREYDYEGDMAKSQLRSIIANAQSVHDMLEDTTNIAEWVQSKITLSADYISTVADYMQSEVNEAVSVKKEKYSWGKMVTVHDGNKTSYPLHPEHQQAIAKLGDGEKTTFKDETNSSVHAHREGDTVHLSRPRTSSTKTPVAHSHFNEEAEQSVAEETLSELKKSTLGSYVKKASDSAAMSAYGAGGESQRLAGEPVSKRPDTYGADRKVALKRLKGIGKATDRLTKEETVLETKGAPKGFHFTKDGKLKRGDADQDGNGGPMLRTDPLDKQRNKVPAVSEGTNNTFKSFRNQLAEKHLTPAEMKKREEVAKAMEREQPGMPMGKKMAIATATAKKAA